MEKKRKIRTYGGYFEAFMETLTEKEQDKIQYGLLLLKTQERLSTKFVKFVQDGVFELRTEYNGNIYRVFFIFDDGNIGFFVKFGGNLFFISTVFFFLNPIKSCRYVCFLVTLKTPHH